MCSAAAPSRFFMAIGLSIRGYAGHIHAMHDSYHAQSIRQMAIKTEKSTIPTTGKHSKTDHHLI
jgi:hypothetical protein